MSYIPYTAPTPSNATWTYVVLANDFSTTSNTAQDVTGMAFTPAVSTNYDIECVALVRTATATVGPRLGCAWGTGITDGIARVQVTSGATSDVLANGNSSNAVLAPIGGLPGTTTSYPAYLSATLLAGGGASGTFKIRLASETNGTSVTIMAGSYLRYRTYA